ncbi:mechanosensitive ion channel family protein [Azospirillum rugosum]|uniref:Small-conductance mechanosensitive channel n=1 Tax=Azospirillum rugosum TaxID=416170 RepID=A0ABS4SSW4_9PROT|nr:mechanosensitive ion channel family protein [Azospirillum rugosum]MBP2295042.1 small-conductance mechanosensitive channel [Azospirillum rugosum]MDQ0528865.1 small-conductance mechanosensitive channel [Azospirillum rugosum]
MAQVEHAVDADLSTTLSSLDGIVDWTMAFLPKFAIGGVVFLLFWGIGWAVRMGILRASARHPARNVGLVLGRLSQWGLRFLGLLVAVTIMFPSVKPVDLLGLLGIGSVAIGFAFKDILQNFLAGILILLRQPFRIGDQIVFKSFEGTVEGIETRTTVIKTYDGRRVFVPNGEIFTNAVTVNTAYGIRRSEHDVGVGYGDDVRRAAGVILDALRGVDGVRDDPPPEALAVELAGSTVNIRARWWTDARQHEVLRVRHDVIAAIKDQLGQAGIDLPFPTRVVLFHDQTEETDGDRRRQREGWPAGDDPPQPRTIAGVLKKTGPDGQEEEPARSIRPGGTPVGHTD